MPVKIQRRIETRVNDTYVRSCDHCGRVEGVTYGPGSFYACDICGAVYCGAFGCTPARCGYVWGDSRDSGWRVCRACGETPDVVYALDALKLALDAFGQVKRSLYEHEQAVESCLVTLRSLRHIPEPEVELIPSDPPPIVRGA